MRTWQYFLLAIVAGILLSAVLYIVIIPPRGQPIVLEPIPTPQPVAIFITGQVKNPGLYYVPDGSRLNDAIVASGGLLPDADIEVINIAGIVIDGQKIIIPEKKEELPIDKSTQMPPSTVDASKSNSIQIKKINVNTAGLEELMTLPGIGQVKAEKIIETRQKIGLFKKPEDLLEVPQIGPAILEQLLPFITLTD